MIDNYKTLFYWTLLFHTIFLVHFSNNYYNNIFNIWHRTKRKNEWKGSGGSNFQFWEVCFLSKQNVSNYTQSDIMWSVYVILNNAFANRQAKLVEIVLNY